MTQSKLLFLTKILHHGLRSDFFFISTNTFSNFYLDFYFPFPIWTSLSLSLFVSLFFLNCYFPYFLFGLLNISLFCFGLLFPFLFYFTFYFYFPFPFFFGLLFIQGYILDFFQFFPPKQIVNWSDLSWWQARKVNSKERPGLVPSQDLEERRKCFVKHNGFNRQISCCGTMVRKTMCHSVFYSHGGNLGYHFFRNALLGTVHELL